MQSLSKENLDFGKYTVVKGSSGLTRGAADIELASGFALFPIALPALSLFTFFIELPCFPPSTDLF